MIVLVVIVEGNPLEARLPEPIKLFRAQSTKQQSRRRKASRNPSNEVFPTVRRPFGCKKLSEFLELEDCALVGCVLGANLQLLGQPSLVLDDEVPIEPPRQARLSILHVVTAKQRYTVHVGRLLARRVLKLPPSVQLVAASWSSFSPMCFRVLGLRILSQWECKNTQSFGFCRGS